MNPFEMPFPSWLTSSFEAPAQSASDYSLYREDFGSIYSLLNTINNRENNSFMRNEDSSQKHGNEEWSGTNSYEEAQSLLIHGYEDPVKSIKSSLAKNKKLTSKIYSSIPKPIAQNRVVGFVPNVPNALRGLPESMITMEIHEVRTPTATHKICGTTHEKFDEVLNIVNLDIPVYLTGKAGTGKNVICQQVAEALGLDFYFTNAVTQEYKLTGFIDANGNYQETQFYKAFTKGGLFFLDEMDASIPETLIILNAAIANRYFDFPNGKVSANPNFRVIAAGNTVGTGADNNYTGRYCLDRASLDRFAMVNIDYSEKIEMAMANNNKNLVSFCHRFREITDKAGIECLFSYRTIDRIAKLETVISNLSEVLSISLLKGMDEDTLSILKNELSEAKDMTNNKYAKAIINGNSWDF